MTGFNEEWFGAASCDVLAKLAGVVTRLPGLIVEIGSWQGRSTCALANAAFPRLIEAVDTWQGSPGEVSADLAAGRDVHAEWSANVARYTRGNVVAHRMGWRDYLPTVQAPIALAFIDAEHTRIEVADNIRALVPLMAPGGIICGDDAHHGPVQDGVLDVLPAAEVYVDATLWIWQKPHEVSTWKVNGKPFDVLAAMYRERCETPSDIYLHLPRFATLVETLNARHVIELGSRSGVSTVAWLYALEKTGGHLTSVDLDKAPEIGVWPHWRHIQADDLKVVDSLEPADIVFIDTSHALQQTRDELAAYLPLVRKGGVIVLHDTELARPEDSPESDGAFPVKRAVVEFVAEHRFEWHNFPDCFGLAIIKVV